MCGLVGEIEDCDTADAGDSRRNLSIGLKSLSCRGPDGSGSTFGQVGNFSVALGHTRLSIQDLSEAASQPFRTEGGDYSLVFNGEIYNFIELRAELSAAGYKFESSGDSEVLIRALQHWGEGALDRLEGMFAFAFFDRKAGHALLARDRFGIKPLYWGKTKRGGLAFASEIDALRPFLDMRKVNEEVAKTYLVFGWHDYGDQTFYEGVNSLKPGQLLRLNLNSDSLRANVEQWWRPSITEKFDGSFDQAASELRRLVLESVSLHLRSDVPVGAALSGGLDSSSLVMAMRYLEPNADIHTFSYIDADSKLSEEKWVDIVSSSGRTTQHKVQLSAADLFNEQFKEMIDYQGEPFGSSSIYAQFQVFKEVNRQGIKVTLDGQGADELFAGYEGYPEHRVLSLIERGEIATLVKFSKSWAKWPGRRARSLLLASLANLTPGLRNSPVLMELATALRLIPPQGVAMIRGPRVTIPTFRRSSEGLGRRLAEELRFSMSSKRLSALLRVADRNSMRWSVESRVPYLNSKVAEFALSLPESFLLSNNGETKRVLRAAMRDIAPNQILDRRDKIGFKAGDAGWLGGDPRAFGLIAGLESHDFINLDAAKSHVSEVVSGKSTFTDLTWRLINLGSWSESKL